MDKLQKNIIIFIILVIITCAIIVRFIITTHTPVKYAIHLEDIWEHPDSILVQEAGHTGTGWEIVGDSENGLYKSYDDYNSIRDVQLEGVIPQEPRGGIGYNNIFLCDVIYLGRDTFQPYGEDTEFDKYKVADWYPIYPVKRDTILPSWFYLNNYLSKADFK